MGIWFQTHTVGKESASWLALWWEKQRKAYWVLQFLSIFLKVLKDWQKVINMLLIFHEKNSWTSKISRNPRCIFVPVHSCYFTGCWLHCLGGGCSGKETGINQSWKTCPQFYDGHPANKKSEWKSPIFGYFDITDISPLCIFDRMFPCFCTSGEKHSCKCSQGDVAHL